MGSSRNQSIRVFVATWNVGGKSPHFSLNLDDFLQTNEPSDLYILGFQEIVPLNAGNVLVIEDNEPATKWLTLISNSLNKSEETEVSSTAESQLKAPESLLFFQKPSLKAMSKTFRTESVKNLKTCNCYSKCRTRYIGDSNANEEDISTEDDESSNLLLSSGDLGYSTNNNQLRYGFVTSKQMVGIFLTIWAKKELLPHIRHLRLSCIGRGIMGYLGNKGCIAVSMSLHQTSFCFICSHLTSGEKEGDELRRNFDVIEILKNTQFRRFSKIPRCKIPKRIIDHDRVIWLGDLNYRIALSYKETRKLLDHGEWDSLLEKDQLRIEREAGRVFSGWNEGQICFPPTYKYSNNSDQYTGESIECRKKRTPAWCDRILWHGDGILQLSYIRNESRFSDHRPVNATFSVEISAFNGKEAFIQL